MRKWNLSINDPLSLTLAADVRFGNNEYLNDHIWEVNIHKGEPPVIAVQTTYGLRAKMMRIFPIFIENDTEIFNPQEFFSEPRILSILPNYIELQLEPLEGIDVRMVFLVPNSQSLLGKLHITNKSPDRREIKVQIACQLIPNKGQPAAPMEFDATTILTGESDGLYPVILLKGGGQAGRGSFSALQQNLLLEPKNEDQLVWAQAAESSIDTSFENAKELLSTNWSAVLARLDLLNTSLIEIYTGNPDWDVVFHLAQKEALNLLINNTDQLPSASMVSMRNIELGFSHRGDGTDYSYSWSGQTPLETYHLLNILSPVAPEIIQGIVENFLLTATRDGFIDLKPGLAGQRSQILATPIIAQMAMSIFQITEDREWLDSHYPILIRFIKKWFSPSCDKDNDGIPEWSHPIQLGIENHPLYSPILESTPNLDIRKSESPSLCTILYNECQALIEIADILNKTVDIPFLETCKSRMVNTIKAMWDETHNLFLDWDRDTHISQDYELLLQHNGSGDIKLDKQFELPRRVHIELYAPTKPSKEIVLFFHATSSTGKSRIDQFHGNDLLWGLNKAYLTTDVFYKTLSKVEIVGLDKDTTVQLFTAGYACDTLTGVLPIWVNKLSIEQFHELVEETITDEEKFWRPFGMPLCSQWTTDDFYNICNSVNPMLNNFVIEGLIDKDYKKEAVILFQKIMDATIQSLKREHCFWQKYHPTSGKGLGEKNELSGLTPVGTFLKLLGVQLLSPQKILLEGDNPFPWPVTIKYKGTTILRQKGKTNIVFPDGQSVIINNSDIQLITTEEIKTKT